MTKASSNNSNFIPIKYNFSTYVKLNLHEQILNHTQPPPNNLNHTHTHTHPPPTNTNKYKLSHTVTLTISSFTYINMHTLSCTASKL